jgi:hypothetical protein
MGLIDSATLIFKARKSAPEITVTLQADAPEELLSKIMFVAAQLGEAPAGNAVAKPAPVIPQGFETDFTPKPAKPKGRAAKELATRDANAEALKWLTRAGLMLPQLGREPGEVAAKLGESRPLATLDTAGQTHIKEQALKICSQAAANPGRPELKIFLDACLVLDANHDNHAAFKIATAAVFGNGNGRLMADHPYLFSYLESEGQKKTAILQAVQELADLADEPTV